MLVKPPNTYSLPSTATPLASKRCSGAGALVCQENSVVVGGSDGWQPLTARSATAVSSVPIVRAGRRVRRSADMERDPHEVPSRDEAARRVRRPHADPDLPVTRGAADVVREGPGRHQVGDQDVGGA